MSIILTSGYTFTIAQSASSLQPSSAGEISLTCNSTFSLLQSEIQRFSERTETYTGRLASLDTQLSDLERILTQESVDIAPLTTMHDTLRSESTRFRITAENHRENLHTLLSIDCTTQEFRTILNREIERRQEIQTIIENIKSLIKDTIRPELLRIRGLYKLN